MSKSILTLAAAAGLAAFSPNAEGAIVFQNFNQTILTNQTFNFGFDGTTLTGGSGDYAITYSAGQYFPEQTYNWVDDDGVPQSYTYPAFTSPPSLTFDTPGYPQYTYEGGNQGGGGAPVIVGDSIQGYDSGWSGGANASYFNLPNIALWLIVKPDGIPGSYVGWIQVSYNNESAVIAGAAFATSGDLLVGDTGNGFFTPVILQNVVVPEPSTYGLALGGLALAVVALRRRAKK